MTSDSRGCNELFLRVDLCCFDENNPFLTEIEPGSMEKFLVSRFSIYENDAASSHWSREPITTLSGPLMFMFSVIRTDYHAGRIFIQHGIAPTWIRRLADPTYYFINPSYSEARVILIVGPPIKLFFVIITSIGLWQIRLRNFSPQLAYKPIGHVKSA